MTPVEQPPPSAPERILAISDGRPGNARQAEALAEALLPGRVEVLHLNPHAPWRWASPRRLPGSEHALGPDFATWLQRAPHWAAGCGRQAALATRLLREAGSRVIQILDPRIAHRHWDWLVIPEHDRISGANVIPMQGSLNPVDDAWLAAARAQFAWLEQFPGPRLTVLVGGDSRHGRLPVEVGREVLKLMPHWYQETGGSLLVTTSRRTPPDLAAGLARQMHALPGLYWSGPSDGPNPYPGLLAFADRILCTADSVNLLSEACATRVPVCIVGARTAKGGPGRFARRLLSSARASTSLFAPLPAITALRETARVAAAIRLSAAS